MAINLQAERLAELAHARESWIPKRNGRAVNSSTVWRWIHKGLESPDGRRIKLDVIYVGNTPMTTAEAVQRFFAALTSAKRSRGVANAGSD